MGYRYETHMHTCEGSACASASGAEMARIHKENGYTGIFVTDHFFNGNTAVPRDLPWRERIGRFCLGYEHAREEGEKIGLDVFFGFEYGVNAADFLVYNLDRQWLLEHEDIDREDARRAFALMRRMNAKRPEREHLPVLTVIARNPGARKGNLSDDRLVFEHDQGQLADKVGRAAHHVQQIMLGASGCIHIPKRLAHERLNLAKLIWAFRTNFYGHGAWQTFEKSIRPYFALRTNARTPIRQATTQT